MRKTLCQLAKSIDYWLNGEQESRPIIEPTDPRIREVSHKIANNAVAINGAIRRLAQYEDPLAELLRRITEEES